MMDLVNLKKKRRPIIYILLCSVLLVTVVACCDMIEIQKNQIESSLSISGTLRYRTDTDASGSKHKLVYTEGRKLKKCVNCELTNSRTNGGQPVKSYFMCQACGVPLCKNLRNCFREFHKFINDDKEIEYSSSYHLPTPDQRRTLLQHPQYP